MTVPLLLASNRGPLSFRRPALGEASRGSFVAQRGGGGLVSAMASTDREALWVCAALTEADRAAARELDGAVAPGVHMLDLDPVTFDRAYNGIANGTLWFVAHLLYDTSTQPSFDARAHREWLAYRSYGASFADALADAAAPGAAVLVQDYHLALTPAQLRERRPDLRIGHFSHTPWAPPEYFSLLPDDVARELLLGMLGADSVGFHSPRWAEAFVRCCVAVLGAVARDGYVLHDAGRTRVSVHPLGVDAASLRGRAQEPDVQDRVTLLRELVGGRQLLLRVDRTELSKNIVRGLEAYRELLRGWPQWRGRVVHVALAYPSRHDLPAYRAYTGEVQRLAREVNEEFAADGWLPVHLDVQDDYPRSLAGYLLADVLLVNPLRDGMNLVAKEGPVLSERGLSLVLSTQAGAADELAADAHVVNPFDVRQTALALHEALSESASSRRERTARLAAASTAMPPSAWLDAQLAALPQGPATSR